MALVKNNFRGYVFWGATERPGFAANLEFLGEPEVHQLDEAGRVQQQVLRLQIAVDDPPGVQVVEGFDNAGCVEPRSSVIKVPAIPEKV